MYKKYYSLVWYILTGAIIGEGDRKSWDSRAPMIWDIFIFTITAEIHARSLPNFYCRYADRHMNLKFMRCVSEREPAIRQFVIVKNKLMSVFNVSVLLLIMNLVITLPK